MPIYQGRHSINFSWVDFPKVGKQLCCPIEHMISFFRGGGKGGGHIIHLNLVIYYRRTSTFRSICMRLSGKIIHIGKSFNCKYCSIATHFNSKSNESY